MKIKSDWWKRGFFDFGMSKILFGAGKVKLATEEAKWIIKTVGVVPPAKILDVGCGIGRHAIVFAKHGFDVLGIDISKIFLTKASRLAKKEGVKLKLENIAMHRLAPYKNNFDLVTSLFTSFGYYSPRSQNFKIFKQMARTIKPGGVIVLDAAYQESIERHFQPKNWRYFEDGSIVLEKRIYLQKDKQIYNDWMYLSGGKTRHYRFKLHLFSIRELEKLFTDNGLKIIGRYSSLKGAPFKKGSFHIVFVARKDPKSKI